MTAAAFERPKEMDSVLLRIPAELKRFAANTAEEENISANSLYAAGVLHATIVYGVLPRIGSPQNLLSLVHDIDKAQKENGPAIGAFDKNDWLETEWLLTMLNDMNWIQDVKVRTDAQAASTIVYSFTFSKVGRAMWPGLSETIRLRLHDCAAFQEEAIAGSVITVSRT